MLFRSEEEKSLLAKSKKFEAIRTDIKNFDTELLQEDLNRILQDTAKVTKEKKWAQSLKKDVHLFETANILEDFLK